MSQNYYGQYGSFGGYNGYQPAVTPSYPTVQPTTNKIYVTSLEDAMQRYASPNSTMIYVLQDESAMFEIYTDPQGKKLPRVRKFVEEISDNPSSEYVSRSEFNELKAKIEAMTGAKGDAV